MKMIELHIIQSFPVTCLNRDDVGAPKSARFGGVPRARVSSQCWKRAIRELATDLNKQSFKGSRTRKAAIELADCLVNQFQWDKAKAQETAESVLHLFLNKKSDSGKAKKRNSETNQQTQTSTLLYLSEFEISIIAQTIDEKLKENASIEDSALKNFAVKVLQKVLPNDAADIAIFGRMVANAPDITLEGSGMFSHALSTHLCSNDIDFWTAVDDEKKPGDDAGSANMSISEFNSACYYRYIGLNLDLLWDSKHLGHFSPDERKPVVDAFLRAAILAVPNARKNSMFGFNPPAYVLGLQRSGQPLSLVNAFESAVSGGPEGYVGKSVDALKNQWHHLQDLYCLKADAEAELPPENLDAFVGKLTGGAA